MQFFKKTYYIEFIFQINCCSQAQKIVLSGDGHTHKRIQHKILNVAAVCDLVLILFL